MDEKWIVNGLNFSKEEKLRFLEHIKERPGIWDYKISYQHKFQKRKEFIDKKVKAWDEITDIYGGKDLSAENRQDLNALLQRKWRMMRDNYVKIYKSNNQKYKSDPLFLAINSFLMEITEENMRIRSKYKFGQKRTKISDDVMRNEKSFKEGDDSNDNIGSRRNFEEEGENNETLGNDDDGIDLGKSTCGELDVPIELELNVDDENNPFGNMLENYNQNFEQPREQDECDVFGQFVAVKLRKLDAEARSRLQFLIHQTIFNEENSIASSRKRVRRIS